MEKVSKISQSKEYIHFRSVIPLKNICVENSKGQSWKVFDAGPKSVQCPMIFLPPACGTADIYFRQLLDLSSCGYRVLSVESPNTYWTVTDWCIGFTLLLDNLGLNEVHLFGASLGGFLAQKFAESTDHRPRVISLFLCNTFADTEIFDFMETASFFWMFPMILLRRLISPSLVPTIPDPDILDAIEFVVEKSNTLRRLDLASRLTINCVSSHVNRAKMRGVKFVTIMDVFDDYALMGRVREEIYDYYPNAKLANLKTGGNYPYLSRYGEVNVHLKIHLMKFEGTSYSAREMKENVEEYLTSEGENDTSSRQTAETEDDLEKKFDELYHSIEEEDAQVGSLENYDNQINEILGEVTSTDAEDQEKEVSGVSDEENFDADDEGECELIRQYCNQMKAQANDDDERTRTE